VLIHIIDAKTSHVLTNKRMHIIFQACTTYKWIDNHLTLLIIVTLFVKMLMKALVVNATFVMFNNTLCMTSIMPQLEEFV
jgi:hypothetical protein